VDKQNYSSTSVIERERKKNRGKEVKFFTCLSDVEPGFYRTPGVIQLWVVLYSIFWRKYSGNNYEERI